MLPLSVCTAADAIATFLRSPSHNLRYVGVDALAGIVKIHPNVAQASASMLGQGWVLPWCRSIRLSLMCPICISVLWLRSQVSHSTPPCVACPHLSLFHFAACPQEHQLAVVDCLEDPDDTLKLKTLELLYKMTKVRAGGDFSSNEVGRVGGDESGTGGEGRHWRKGVRGGNKMRGWQKKVRE